MRRVKRGEAVVNTAPRKLHNGRHRRKKTLTAAAHHAEETTVKATLWLGLRLYEEGCLDEDTTARRVVAVGRAREVAALRTAGLRTQIAWASFIHVGTQCMATSDGMDAAWPLCPPWRPRGR
jgi:hypothetical protein